MDINQRLSSLGIIREQGVSLIEQLIQEIEKLKKEDNKENTDAK